MENKMICAGCSELTTPGSPYTCKTCGMMLCGNCGNYCLSHKPVGSARSDQANYNREYYERKKEEIAEQKKKYREAIKHDVIVLLDGKCSQCGFENEKALFVVGGGGRGKMSYVAWWNFLFHELNKKESTPYLLVCANCREIHELV